MKKIFISIAIGAFSTLAMAKLVVFIPNEAGSKYTMPVNCTGRATTDRNALIAKIDAGDDVTKFDTQCIKDFSELFSDNRSGANLSVVRSFNQYIGAWDVSSGTDFSYMFSKASSFNKDIHLWDVENATSYNYFRLSSPLTSDNTPFKFGGSVQDSDGDGVSDHTEVYNETDPLDPASL